MSAVIALFLRALILVLAMTASALAMVDVNTANSGELETLPGIGPSKAAAIIAYREEHGPFQTLAQLDRVSGIGEATLHNLDGKVSFGEESKDQQGADSTRTQSADKGEASKSAPQPSSQLPRINVNLASSGELEELPGIGPSKAAAILEYREQNGLFDSCASLEAVRGIGPATVANFEGRCTTE